MECARDRRRPGGGLGAFGSGRMTTQRRRLSEAVVSIGVAFTVEDLVEAVGPDRMRPSRATAYRAVRAMCDSRFLERIGDRDGHALYAHCGGAGHHHHHLMCTACGAVAEAPCPLAADAKESAERAGFVLTGHDVVLYGLCRRCAAVVEG